MVFKITSSATFRPWVGVGVWVCCYLVPVSVLCPDQSVTACGLQKGCNFLSGSEGRFEGWCLCVVCPRAFEQISSFNVLIFIYGRSAYAVVLVWRSEKE